MGGDIPANSEWISLPGQALAARPSSSSETRRFPPPLTKGLALSGTLFHKINITKPWRCQPKIERMAIIFFVDLFEIRYNNPASFQEGVE
jgi:hypothetical protein